MPRLVLLFGPVLATASGAASPGAHFPPPGEAPALQDRRTPEAVGLKPDLVPRLRAFRPGARWALWRHGRLVHVEGDFHAVTEVKSLCKTWHALAVGAALGQGRIPSLHQKLSAWLPELRGKDAEVSWQHVLTQTSGFDYPYGGHPAYRPGEIWTYSDKNLRHLCNALARVYGKRDYRDGYEEVLRAACFDAIGLRGWSARPAEDGVRLLLDLEDMGRLGLLVLARGRWNGRQVVPRAFVEALETRQTRGARVNYDGPDDGRVDLDPARFPEAPYGFLTWVNTGGDYFPGADRAWAWGAGAGGTWVLWNHRYGLVFAAVGASPAPSREGVPHLLETGVGGPDPLAGAAGGK